MILLLLVLISIGFASIGIIWLVESIQNKQIQCLLPKKTVNRFILLMLTYDSIFIIFSIIQALVWGDLKKPVLYQPFPISINYLTCLIKGKYNGDEYQSTYEITSPSYYISFVIFSTLVFVIGYIQRKNTSPFPILFERVKKIFSYSNTIDLILILTFPVSKLFFSGILFGMAGLFGALINWSIRFPLVALVIVPSLLIEIIYRAYRKKGLQDAEIEVVEKKPKLFRSAIQALLTPLLLFLLLIFETIFYFNLLFYFVEPTFFDSGDF